MTEVGSGGVKIAQVELSRRFKRDRRKLPKHVDQQLKYKLEGLYKNPRPPGIRFEKLEGYTNPDIYTIHITMNYKVSMTIDGDKATLRRVGKHDYIDRRP